MSSANRASVRLAMLPAVVALACACSSGSGPAGGVNDTGTGGATAGSGGVFGAASGGSRASPASGTAGTVGAGTRGAGGAMVGGGGALGTGDAAVMRPDAGQAPDPDGLYVSPAGDDANPGTLAKPVRTLSKSRDLVRGINASMTGDIHVYLRGGTYEVTATIAFGPMDSGTNGHRIFYEAYP